MKLTIEPTGKFETVNGNMCRLWKGTTEKGEPVELYVAVVAAKSKAAEAELETALREVKVERQLVSFDLRLVI